MLVLKYVSDQIIWLYGSGFPKSLDVSKAIDKSYGEQREVIASTPTGGYKRLMTHNQEEGFRPDDYYPEGNKFTSNEPITDTAKQWNGWGTALKPAHEPICVARKPLSEKTVAANVIKYGTGALNIDGCRVDHASAQDKKHQEDIRRGQATATNGRMFGDGNCKSAVASVTLTGRWPANIIHDSSEESNLFPTPLWTT